jgi:putative endonuclease
MGQHHMAQYYVCIMTNATRTLYIKSKLTDGFTKKYNVTWLAYYDGTCDVAAGLTREKQLTKWRKGGKGALIQSMNAQWKDLARDWYDE